MRRIFFLLALLLLAPGLLQAAETLNVGLSDVVKTLEAPFQSGTVPGAAIDDFEADFFQESHLVSLDRTQRGRGRVMVRFDRRRSERVPRAMFRWEYRQPTTQEIVSDGRTLWVYLPENRQVIQTDIEFTSQSRPGDPVTFLTGLGNLSRDFNIAWATPNRDVEGNWVLELEPRRVSPMIRRLLLVVDHEAVYELVSQGKTGQRFPLLSSTVFDPSGNRTIIEFSDIVSNRGIPSSRFDFLLPAGVEVLRPSGSEMGF